MKRKEISALYGNMIKDALAAKGVSQYWLQDNTGLCVSTINKIVTGKSVPSLPTVALINEVLGLKIDRKFSHLVQGGIN
jgi:ribosome-binding protein aMBF1 (putative translation factor)